MNRTFYFAIFLLFSPCLFAQQFDFQNYSVGAGLAQSQVYALCQDQHGYIWMGTRGGGLSRFDGIRFEQFTQRDGLASNYVNTILEDQTGRIWIGCSDGLSCYDNRKLKSNTLKGISVLDLTQVSDTLFIGTNKGLWMKYDTLPPKQLPRLKDYTVRALYYAQDSSLWLATNQGPIALKNGKTRLLKRKNGFYNPEVMDFVETPNGELWMALFGTGVIVMDSSRQRITNYRPEIGSRLVQTLYLDRKKRIWAGTQDNGLALFNTADSSFTYLSESDGLAKNDVRTIIEDNWRNIWIGTSGGGVSKYAGQLFEHYDESNGLPEDYIYSVAADSAGQLWVSSYDEGFTILTDTAMVPVNAENGFLDVKVKAMFRDRENRMWIGTEGSGLALKDSSGFRFFQTRDGLAGNWIRTITQDQDGHIWVGSASGGLTELVPKDSSLYEFELQVYRKRDGLPGQNINDLEVDSLNRLWIGLRSDGLACLQNGKVVHTLKNALPSVYVRSITEDAFGYLWVGMADAGIARVDIYSDSIEVLAFDGLTSNNVYLLQLDEDQNLWVGSERGVDLVQFDEERNISTIQHFGRAEGFIGIETCQNASLKDADGNLWFGTINGLTRYHPRNMRRNPTPPKLLLTDVKLFYESIQNTDYEAYYPSNNDLAATLSGNTSSNNQVLVLPYNENHLEFDFLGINHSNSNRVTYQWQLVGLESDWSPRTQRTTATYPDLSPGRYQFRVRAFNEDGVPSYPIQRFNFVIEPPYWDTLWFKSLLIGLGILVVGVIFWSIIGSIRRKARQREEKLQLEKNALELEQRALQLQMNPHFIFHTLNSIQRLIASQEPQTARYYLSKFARLMRTMLEHSRENWISMESELDLMRNYLLLEQFSQSNGFDFEIQLADDLDPEELRIPPMMMQPFLENAIIHGITPLKTKGRIEVRFALQNQHLECIIKDNGVGRAFAKNRRAQLAQNHKSTALQVTQERLDILQPAQQLKSLEILDLKDEKGHPKGTEVHLRLPFQIQL